MSSFVMSKGVKAMKLISVLSGNGFVMYNKEMAHSVSVNGSIIFGQLCSSYESFGSKHMLTIRDNKEYFFLTADTLERETALTYKQQIKAVRELERSGYIETKIMGVPSKKYFHITDKIVHELLPSSDKREDLEESKNIAEVEQNVHSSYDKKEHLEYTNHTGKDNQKRSSIKKKNKKEQYKDNKLNIVNKDVPVNNIVNESVVNVVQETILNLTNEYRLKGLSKEVCLRVVEEAKQKEDIHNFGAYLRTCLENTLYKSKLKKGEIEFPLMSQSGALFNWLED
jgi:hypothetical protein